jgi:hypothetical protein
MKLRIACMKCSRNNPNDLYAIPVEIRDDNLYKTTCPAGHEIVCMLQSLKFELLFDSGSMAFIDGYYREAVASWAAALERFYEFYIRVVAEKFGVKAEDFDPTWKFVAKQSERQFGVFLSAYLMANRASFSEIISKTNFEKRNTFRNDVVHSGKFPSQSETAEYGEYVYDMTNKLLKKMRTDYSEELQNVVSKQLAKTYELTNGSKYDEETDSYFSPTAMSIPTMISVSRIDEPPTFEEALKSFSGFSVWRCFREQGSADGQDGEEGK